MTLYHFTCSHRAPLIEDRGVLLPHPQPLLGALPLIWLTDMTEPDRAALGLTSHSLRCDRTEWRCSVDEAGAVAWREWWPGRIDFATVSELTFGRKPSRWWVAETPLPVLSIEPTP